MAISKIKTGSITTDAITEAKVADAAIENEHLNANIITGQTELAEQAASDDVLLVYDVNAGVLKKVLKSNISPQVPTISSVSPTSVLTGDGTGNATFTITGADFDGTATAVLITDGGSEVSFDTVTRDSSTQITGVIAVSSLSNANEPYDVKVTNGSGLANTLTNQINIDASPTFVTASGSVGSLSEQTTITPIDIIAYDPESASNITFEIQSGSLPPGLTATTVNENGVSKYRISGTLSTDRSSSVTTNFTIRAADANSNVSSRAFSITELPSGVESFTSSGTFSVPTGITSVDVLVVAGGGGGGRQHGGGGGAGGLIFRPGFPVTPGGTVSVTVGCGGVGSPGPGPSGAGGIAPSGQDSIFGTLSARAGGGGGSWASGGSGPGGSSGGSTGSSPVPAATQPTQPGDSGAYGFGNIGGVGPQGGGGGGGAGGAGAANGGQVNLGGPGGIGRAYTIADGTTPVYYAGGGGGGGHPGNGGDAGQGGGGYGTEFQTGSPGSGPSQNGEANKGGGGGGSGEPAQGGTGGKGIVIVRY